MIDVNVKRIEFYYKGTKLVDNAFTACLLFGENNKLLARGITICSVMDTNCKKTARLYSKGRAYKALKIKDNGGHISDDIRWKDGYVIRRKKHKIGESRGFIKILNDYSIYWKLISQKDGIKTIQYKLPKNHSIEFTRELFEWKYQYMPEPNRFERVNFKLKGSYS